jgi:hypothetical protein
MIVDTVVDGRKVKAFVPDNAEEYEYSRGVVIGPPDLSSLGLPIEIETRLNDELYARGLIGINDVRKNRQEVLYALQTALAVTVERIMECYNG